MMETVRDAPAGESGIRLISIILSPRQYPDRFQLLFELGRHVDRHVILTRDPIDVPDRAVRTTLHHNGGRLTGPRHWWWAFRTASRIVRESPPGPWIINEHQVGLTALLLRLRFPRRLHLVVSGYSAEVTLLLRRRWKDDPHRGDLSWRQHLRYIAGGFRKVPIHIVSRLAAHTVVGNSQQVVDDVRMLLPWKRTGVVPSAVDLALFTPPACAREWRGGGSDLELLYVGDLHLFKGIGTLLATVRILRRRGVPVKLTLVGSASSADREWLERRLHEEGVAPHVTLTGKIERSDLVARYRSADIFVFPSFHEGSPRVVKEALACGCPAIVTDIPGTRVLDPEGKTLRYFEPGDAAGLADRVTETIEGNRRPELADAARELANRFGPRTIAAAYARFYRTLSSDGDRYPPDPSSEGR